MATFTITFDYGEYDGQTVVDEFDGDTYSLDFGEYAGHPVVAPEQAAAGQPFIKRFGGVPYAASLGRGIW